MVAVVAGLGSVTYYASASEVSPASDARAVPVPAIADVIRPPAGSRQIGSFVVASGTQTYTCVVASGATTGAYTGASVPEARLTGRPGRIHHFAGPSWQSERDGSLVTATKTAANARTGTIPELLLQVATHSGSGILSRADYINRLATSGGVAPTSACAAGETVSVPYKAVYVFWDAPAA
ncbi:DUF3455 domain-containing protein [Actinoplanes palleronii]|nr:DUF3455 domain-containing protein [Actinoplanes palleronii]